MPVERCVQDGCAIATDYAGHGIERQNPTPLLRHDRRGIDDRRDEHPDLDHERDDVAKIPVGNCQGGEERTDAERRHHGEQDEYGGQGKRH